MKKKFINQTHIEGFLYEHDLKIKESGPNSKNPGTEFIAGSVSIATDNAQTNVVSVNFTYVTAVTANGKANGSFKILKDIIEENYFSVMKHGKESATKISIDSAIGLNEFYTTRDGEETLVSVKRNEGGFIHVVSALNEDENKRNTFEVDMLINSTLHLEEDEEKQIPERVIVKGAVFDFRKSLMPVDFIATNSGAMSYFDGLEASPTTPTFTKLWGRQESKVITREIVEESAFGDSSVREVKNTRKNFIITGAAREPYVWDDEEYLTGAELTEMVSARNIALATMKKRQEEYQANKGKEPAKVTPATAPKTGGYAF